MEMFEKLFGVNRPIIQAPMAGVQDSKLAIAVSKAGGIGSLPCSMLSLKQIAKEISIIQSQTDKAFNVNFFCHEEPKRDQQKEAHWKHILLPYYQEYNLNPNQYDIATDEQRKAFNFEIAHILSKYKPPIVSFHFGLPSDELLKYVKSWGAKVLSTATTVEEAIYLERRGADIIIAQGVEAGGHRGHFLSNDLTQQVEISALLTKVVKAVRCPVIAAGGIADKHTVQKALKLGAVGVQVGTAYLLSPEVHTKSLHRSAIKMPHRPTVLTNLFSGRPARGIMNRFMEEMGPINDRTPVFPLAADFIAPIRQLAEAKGIDDFSPLWCGKHRIHCKEIAAAQITEILTEGLY